MNRRVMGRRAVAPIGPAPAAILTVCLFGTLAAACGRTADERQAIERVRETGYRGIVLPEPIPAPDFTLTDTEGEAFRFREETAGHLTLLFFGYTHCPDICPVQMANISAVLDDLTYEQRRRVLMVFVTTDPERDTPERLREWLDRFDRSFVGLIGAREEVNRIQRRLNLAPAVKLEGEGEGYTVGHASQVLAFGPDGSARLAYPSGMRQADWAHDLPKLLEELAAERAPMGD